MYFHRLKNIKIRLLF